MTIRRFSSRRHDLATAFLTERLHNARAYDRIAGYFSSSLLAVIGDTLDSVQGTIRVVCNSDLSPNDVATARAAQQAMRREWCDTAPEVRYEHSKPQLQRLYELLRSGKLEVRVLPSVTFGLEHGKAGVITTADGSKTAFMGSANETLSGWQVNYELLWEDDSPEAVQWVEEEFTFLWLHPHAISLAEFVIEDIGRLAKRVVIPSVAQWRNASHPKPAAPVIETPVYRREMGLWQHQKYFIEKAYHAHQQRSGARFILADMVGLGKTVQLATAAMLMALHGNRPILVIAPRPLIAQWQAELRNLLAMPSAIWNGKQWVDEQGIEYPPQGTQPIRRCPRRVGIISQGLITRGSSIVAPLKEIEYECVIVDEAHRARRKNLGPGKRGQPPQPNNLLRFLHAVSPRTKSMLLATATPVQLDPIEAWDLLDVLACGNEHVLGDAVSQWRIGQQAVDVVMGQQAIPHDLGSLWQWVRNPLPPRGEHTDFRILRQQLGMDDDSPVAHSTNLDTLSPSGQQRLERIADDFGTHHNPFIRHIVRRTRHYLETTIDPATGEPYLKKITVKLSGERSSDAIQFTPYLKEAYEKAEAFCALFAQRKSGAGFYKTILLRRIGSSIAAGLRTGEAMLKRHVDLDSEDDDGIEDDADSRGVAAPSNAYDLQPEEEQLLRTFLDLLQAHTNADPKHAVVEQLLVQDGWLRRGCIIFSQYYDSIASLAEYLQQRIPDVPVGIYAGGNRSGVFQSGQFVAFDRETIKQMVGTDQLRLLLGTDAASEGLNLQRLSTLINLDLPWNPTRLEQRKGRIQRIGQIHDEVWIYNMRYAGSVEDQVHAMLSARLESIYGLFGQLPDVLEDAWIAIAEGEKEKVAQIIDSVPQKHPFEVKYHEHVQNVDWESCSEVLNDSERHRYLQQGWGELS